MKKSAFRFTNPVLTAIEFKVNDDFSPNDDKVKMIDGFKVSVYKNEEELSAIVSLEYKLSSEDDNSPFILSATMQAMFEWDEKISDDKSEIDNILKKNAPFLLLGYLRPIVASTTNASCFPSYNIPYIDLND